MKLINGKDYFNLLILKYIFLKILIYDNHFESYLNLIQLKLEQI